MSALAQRRSLLTVALSLSQLQGREPTIPPVVPEFRGWLDSWTGLGTIVAGMTRQGYDLVLQQYPHGWGANFYLAGPSHPVSLGTGWATTPWAAVQAAAWERLTVGNPEARLQALLSKTRPGSPPETPDPAAGPSPSGRHDSSLARPGGGAVDR